MQTLEELLQSISAANMVDIAIMACLIYFILSWFRGTRAFQILVTLLAIGVFYFVASALGLILTSVLFQYLWAAIIVVLVIVFQPEIREMLDRVSPVRYLSGRQSNDVGPGMLDETVRAVAELARLRIGALIVLQRMDILDILILKGKTLDTVMSAEALVMIFQKTSPLHDGAVLISKERIHAASCILPLSTDEALSSRYGTRHRAALGLTERSDALCIVVSEERGEVSLVEDKEITVYKKKGEFRQALERGLVRGVAAETGGPRPNALTLLKSNWPLKLAAAGCAMVLWFVIVGPQRSEVGMSIPIQYTNLPPSMEITGKWMDRIDVRIRGSESGLANLKPGSVRAVVDLSGVIPGLNYFRITSKNLLVPPGITTSQIRPSDLHLNIEAASVRKISVVPTIVGAIPDKTKVAVLPSEVTIRAVQGDLKKVVSVTTEPISVAELSAKRRVMTLVQVKPDGLKIDSIEPMQVAVTMEPESQ
ncbi:MAG: TIGR00159 family protein [Desulfomonile tiedjei]|nr:TIGR00159 family protein [Desulfomonile tiedjei]